MEIEGSFDALQSLLECASTSPTLGEGSTALPQLAQHLPWVRSPSGNRDKRKPGSCSLCYGDRNTLPGYRSREHGPARERPQEGTRRYQEGENGGAWEGGAFAASHDSRG